MSQSEEALSLLAEAEAWCPEECLRHLPAALPRLLSLYQVIDNWSQRLGVLRILMEKFLPQIHLSELEQTFSSKVLPKTVEFFDVLLYEISSHAEQLTSQNEELHMTMKNHIQTMVLVLEALTGCVRHICGLQETLPLDYVHSLPLSILHIIKKTYIHCKSLFKEAYALQKQIMEMIEIVSVNSCAADESVAVMVSVIHILLEICSAVSSIDRALHANTWKFIIRQSLKHKSQIKNSLKHSDILCSLCEDILFSFQSCLQLAEQMKCSGTQESTDYKLFQRMNKLCRFFANSLQHYTKEFASFLVDSCSLLHQTYLQIHSRFPPSLHAPVISKSHQDEMARGFLVTLDSLLSLLVSFRPFVEVVLSKTPDLPPELYFPQCRLLLSVMDTLPCQPQDVQTIWNTGSQFPKEIPRMTLLSALFHSLQQCSGELSLPVLSPGMMETEQDKSTFYHYVCIHLCAFITTFSVSHFHLLECSLLETILGSNTITALLAMDAWCFLARFETADLCAHHTFIIAHLLKVCPAESYQATLLGVLLRRLLFLMTAEHQVKFADKFPPKDTENLQLWQHLSLQALTPLLRPQVAREIFVVGFTQCQEWLNSGRSLDEFPQVNIAFSALLSVCQTSGETLEPKQRLALLGTLGQFVAVLHATEVSSLSHLQHGCCLIFRLLQLFIQMLEPQLLIQILALQTSLIQLNPSDHILIAILDFLSSVGKTFIVPDFQGQILPELCSLFATLLANNNWIIQQHAIEVFTQFAEEVQSKQIGALTNSWDMKRIKETSHEDILPQCLKSEEIKSKVVIFLSKTVDIEEPAEAQAERMKKENALLSSSHLGETTEERQSDLILEPSPKRICYSPSEVQYTSAIDSAERTLEVLKQLLQKGPPPIWLAKKLDTLQVTLSNLRKTIS
ncbi:FIGNL1-interacting regulator of recombination and mitosis isoform X3 [Anolis carolinensis]|uniref:FIGNL1-interacting regulator of recombination and mitosis isoform X3 n=1 Tax=Anolis carolinensis TaxID=28377 RepID=UPI002F2B7DDA